MPLIKDQQIIANDWQHADDTSELPAGKVTVPLSRWLAERDALSARGDIGLRLIATDTLDAIKDDLSHFEIIAIEFTKFNDGRGFSLARLLRERYGFQGEIRAIGRFLRDQLYYLQRCGFNAFELAEDTDIEDALKAFTAFSVIAQPDVLHQKESVQAGPWR
jgi:uncharacterized protein (DUF934 family)